MAKIRVKVWNEFVHETQGHKEVLRHYPKGIHHTIAGFLSKQKDFEVSTATLQQPEHGLDEKSLARTDVLTWWAHMAHGEVSDAVAERVQRRVLEGMGLLVLHSGHYSKPFKRLMGTTCSLKWREANEKERIWTAEPSHPIADGIPETFTLAHTEMYGEPFGIPNPEHTVFISWYEGGNVFRSGVTFSRGAGKVFYFAPGHETHPIYHDPVIQKVIVNGVRWAQARVRIPDGAPNSPAVEKIYTK
jgi:trehalose utilization protein